MTEQCLDHPDIDTALKQVGGEAVAQRVRRHPRPDPGGLRRGVDGAVELTGRERVDRVAIFQYLEVKMGCGRPPRRSRQGDHFALENPLSSVYEKGGKRQSRIVSTLTPGNVVTTPRTDMMYVVTEHGIVNLKGKSVADRTKALIGLAHPDFRESLEREARACHLVPRAYW